MDGVSNALRFGILLLIVLQSLSGCGTFSMPDVSLPSLEFGEEEKPNPTLPVSVVYAFDSSVTEATLEVNACGLPYTIQSGELIPQAFMQVGHERFQSVTAYAGTGKAVQASQPADVTVQIQLVTQAVQSATSMADEENAIAFVDVQLHAAYLDANGNELARQPLNYNERVSIWTPALTGQSVSCTTGRYDDLIVSAALQLAGQMASIVPELLNQPVPQQQTAQVVAARQPRAAASRQSPSSKPIRSTLKFRTMLKDENNNLVLDAGEVISLHVEITNTGQTLLEGVAIDLTGTPAVVKAFTAITPIPLSVGSCQPGETRTIEIRGKMPLTVPTQHGELTVSVNRGDGSVIGSHRILATLQPGSGHSTPRANVGRVTAVPRPNNRKPGEEPYLAVLIGMDRYRDTWPGAYRTRRGHVAALTRTLQTTGFFTGQTIRILEGTRATRTKIEETLIKWSRRRLRQDGVLVFYFSGQALNHLKTGDVYLVPFEGSPHATAARLIPLRALQRVLAKLGNRLTLLILDAPVTPLRVTGGTGFDEAAPTQWATGLPRPGHHGTRVIQIRKTRSHDTRDQADILAGLFGRADADDNGTITVGEFLNDVSAMAEITPMLPADAPEADIPIAQ